MTVTLRESQKAKLSWKSRVTLPKVGFFIATIKRLSRTGVYIESKRSVAVGAQVILESRPLVNRNALHLRVPATVTSVVMLSNCSGYGIGLSFGELSKEQIETIKNCVRWQDALGG